MASGAVLVTGASTGIGEATALHLRELGFDPVAGVRRDEDAERLESQGLRTVRLDVTDGAQIAAARDAVDGLLAGLVNNAGVGVAAPLEFLPLDQLRRQLEVNLIGQVAVIQAFLPALRRAGGRIVNGSSIGGRVAAPLLSPYNASKFALEAISDSLRRELRTQGVDVIVIEPGGVKTPIWKKGNELAGEMIAGMPPEAERRPTHGVGRGRRSRRGRSRRGDTRRSDGRRDGDSGPPGASRRSSRRPNRATTSPSTTAAAPAMTPAGSPASAFPLRSSARSALLPALLLGSSASPAPGLTPGPLSSASRLPEDVRLLPGLSGAAPASRDPAAFVAAAGPLAAVPAAGRLVEPPPSSAGAPPARASAGAASRAGRLRGRSRGTVASGSGLRRIAASA